MYIIKFSSSFKSDYKKIKNQRKLVELFKESMELLAKWGSLWKWRLDHNLSGNLKGFREYHLTPDVLDIYKKNIKEKIITFSAIGSHAKLFK